MSDIRILIVWYEHQKMGRLEDNNGVWSFIYDDHWLNNEQAFSLSPQISMTQKQHIDNSTHRYVQWFFDNLLPEENARKVIADDKKLDQEDAFGLLTLFGAESAGALTLLKPDEPWGEAFVEPSAKPKGLNNYHSITCCCLPKHWVCLSAWLKLKPAKCAVLSCLRLMNFISSLKPFMIPAIKAEICGC